MPVNLVPIAGDASLRRYFRFAGGGQGIVAVDVPPSESVARFVAMRTRFDECGLRVPRILATEIAEGFMLIEDFGDETYERAFPATGLKQLYEPALRAINRLQSCCAPQGLESFDETFIKRELALFPDWYCARYVRQPLTFAEQNDYDQVCAHLIEIAQAQAQVPMHRDFHSRNLFVLANGPGIIDFQDAVLGPITYDLASTLRDLYVPIGPAAERDLLAAHWAAARVEGLPVARVFRLFERDYDFVSVQRLTKIMGLFPRANELAGKRNLLQYLPRCGALLCSRAARYPELRPLQTMVARRL